MKSLDVIALGGNAILPAGQSGSISEQFAITRVTMSQIASTVAAGRRIVLTHGNGPIVGNIMLRNEAAKNQIPPMPLGICVADSQGGMGYMIQQVLRNALLARNIDREVVTLVTQVQIDGGDPALQNPTKPIGPYYPDAEVDRLRKLEGWQLVEVPSRGWRRVVPSPMPLAIVEEQTIRWLIEHGTIVIAVGGGGIPVVDNDGQLDGIEAVVDKDYATAILATHLEAERMIIVTEIDAVYRDFGTDRAAPIRELSARAAQEMSRDMPAGSMGSKLAAAASFVRATQTGVAVITRPDDIVAALNGEAGTRITIGDE